MGKPYTVTRVARVAARPERVQGLVVDFHAWRQWSPWEDLDPDMRRTYAGPPASVGAHYAWEGNRKAGKGSMTITRDVPGRVEVDLHFVKPFAARNTIEFLLVPEGESTVVEWRMHGQLGPMMRALSFVRSMDSLVGPDFEKGLARLKRVVEAE
jgi:hypothetical protein